MERKTKSYLRVLLFAVLLLPLLALSSCSSPNDDDDSTVLSSSLPSSPNYKPTDYLSSYSWKQISETKFVAIWDSYDLTVQTYKKANFCQKDKKMGETKLYWECPIERYGTTFVLSYGLGNSVSPALTRKQTGYDAVYQAKEDSSLIRFYNRYDDGRVYESIFKNGWLVQVSEESDSKSYVEYIDYWTD